MTHLRYKDYQGSVTYADGALLIQILHIDDLITTQCENAGEAQKAFEELVDDYIQTCAELNKQPSKPFKGSFNVRVTPALHRKLAMQAAEVGESLNSYVEKALEEKVERVASHKQFFVASNFWRMIESYQPGEWSRGSSRLERSSPVVRTSSKVFAEVYRVRN